MMKKMCFYAAIVLFAWMAGAGCEKNSPDNGGQNSNYDVDFQANHALGVYYYEPEYMGELSNFILTMADVQILGDAEYPKYESAGNAVSINMYVNASEEGVLPAGKYNFSDDMEIEPVSFTFSKEYTYYTETKADGSEGELVEFLSADLEVLKSATTYTVELTATMTNGITLHASYSGELKFIKPEGGDEDLFPPIDHDTNVTLVDYKAYYYGIKDSGAAHFSFQLTDYINDGVNFTGNVLFLDLFSNVSVHNGNNVPAPGNYTVAANIEDEQAGVITPGYIDSDNLVNKGTNLMYSERDGDLYISQYGFAKSGTVNVAVSGDTYTITVNLTDQNGYKIEGKYIGELSIVNRSYNSTLTDDHVADVAGLPCEIDYYGQYYSHLGIDGENWTIYIMNQKDGTEGLQIDLIAPKGDGYAGKLPVGKYTVNKTYTQGSYTCIPGELHGIELYCSWWLGAFNGGGADMQAPFTSGFVDISKSGSTYTIEVDVYDDATVKHNVTGSWTGSPKFFDKSSSDASIAHRMSKSSYVKTDKNVFETKVPYRTGYFSPRK